MNPPPAERRHGERRSTDRRAADGQRKDERRDERRDERQQDGRRRAGPDSELRAAAESFFDPDWMTAGDLPGDSRLALPEAHLMDRARGNALSRIYRTYAAARAAIGVGLVCVLGVGNLFGTHSAAWLVGVSLVYAVQAITLWLLPRFEPQPRQPPQPLSSSRRRHWLATVGVDLGAFTLLHLLDVGGAFNYAALLVLPVLMAGVLTSRLLALGTAAAVALMLLGVAWRTALGNPESSALLMQSGLAGLGMFLITLLAGELAGRLAGEETAARESLEVARQQAQLNRLVIEEMADGVLVIDRRLRVRAANPAARALLVDQGQGPAAPFVLTARGDWAGLQLAAERALAEGHWPDGGRDVLLSFGQGLTRTLRLRVRFMRVRPGEAPGATQAAAAADEAGSQPFAVMLLEDLRTLQARIRQEKLAAMGRVSAGIAHEIRNPLAAIAQANALMLEDELAPVQLQLARMVADNVERLKRLVDDVMEVAPGAAVVNTIIDARQSVADATTDWARTANMALAPDSRLRAELPALPVGVQFDPEHLRRVLVNLLDNAQRHAGQAPGAIFLHLAARDENWATLSVLSDGVPITPEVERHLFEPFFSTRSRGTGLGLYICRELCERYGASIEYRPRPTAERLRNEFIVRMRRASLVEAASPLPQPPERV